MPNSYFYAYFKPPATANDWQQRTAGGGGGSGGLLTSHPHRNAVFRQNTIQASNDNSFRIKNNYNSHINHNDNCCCINQDHDYKNACQTEDHMIDFFYEKLCNKFYEKLVDKQDQKNYSDSDSDCMIACILILKVYSMFLLKKLMTLFKMKKALQSVLMFMMVAYFYIDFCMKKRKIFIILTLIVFIIAVSLAITYAEYLRRRDNDYIRRDDEITSKY